MLEYHRDAFWIYHRICWRICWYPQELQRFIFFASCWSVLRSQALETPQEPHCTWPGTCTSLQIWAFSGLKTPLAYAVGENVTYLASQGGNCSGYVIRNFSISTRIWGQNWTPSASNIHWFSMGKQWEWFWCPTSLQIILSHFKLHLRLYIYIPIISMIVGWHVPLYPTLYMPIALYV